MRSPNSVLCSDYKGDNHPLSLVTWLGIAHGITERWMGIPARSARIDKNICPPIAIRGMSALRKIFMALGTVAFPQPF